MSNITPFDAKLPAHLSAFESVSEDDLSSGVSASFPVISIKGKVFHIVRGDERTLITKPGGEEDEPASSIEVVLLRANPSVSKVYYAEGYTEGSVDKPTCYSNSGIAPEMDAQEPQSQKCAGCVHNQWGSRITESGKKAKACGDVRRLAVAAAGELGDPMLLRVPATSLAVLAQYGDVLKKRGVKYPALITRIGFDYSVAHPALTFKPVGFIDEVAAKKVREVMSGDLISQILGMSEVTGGPIQPDKPRVPDTPKAVQQQPTPAPVPPAPVAATPAPAPARSDAKPRASRKAKAAPNPFSTGTASDIPAPPPVQATEGKDAEVVDVALSGDLEAALDRVLAGGGFDKTAE